LETENTMLKPTDIAAAAKRLTGIVNHTPVMTSRTLNEICGCKVYLKCENFQRVGAFKFRGAYNAVSQLTEEQKANGVVTHSSGNHAQGLALAAKLNGVKATIVMPEDSPPVKKAATAGYGAEIVTCPAVDREKVSAELVEKYGYTLIHPYDNDDIIAGQGTAAWELFEEVGELDTLFVPVGGGGLISGSALATAVKSPNCRVVGVEPAAGDDANRSWRSNQIVSLDTVPQTIADGLRTRFIGPRNLAVMQEYVHDMTTADDDAILETLEFLWTRMKIVVEPSSAAALAPLFTGQYQSNGKRVGVILSGGNVDFHTIVPLLAARKPTAAAPLPAATFAPSRQPIKRPRVLVCDPIDAAGLEILEKTAVIDHQPQISEEALLAQIEEVEAVIVGQDTQLTEQMIENGYNLRAIGCLGTRLDNIDVSAARSMGISVVNVPSSGSVAIAEHVLGWMLALASRFADGRLAGKTIGIIGFGRVGRQVARRARAFDMRVIVNQPRLTPELALAAGVEATDLVELLKQSDFVSIHVRHNEKTNPILGTEEFALMKSSASVINPGQTELIDESALLAALINGRLSDAAVPEFPSDQDEIDEIAQQLRNHPRVMVVPHATTIVGNRQRDAAISIAQQITAVLEKKRPSETLSLDLVPAELVVPHEQVDDKRVARLMNRLEEDGLLANPPIATFWNGKYVVLDGATRATAFKRLEYPYLIVQVVPPDEGRFQLHTWYHAISGGQRVTPRTFADLQQHLKTIAGLVFEPLPTANVSQAFQDKRAICYFLNRKGNATVAKAAEGYDRLAVMNDLVAAYTKWGNVERTLLTDMPRLLSQFPQITAVAIFPQFQPETIFDVASKGDLVPAGLTRFVIPGRILRLNADLARLKQDEPLQAKRFWFNEFLEEKLARSRLRYYEEPVVLLDE
jgi:threonine dehydratase/phosphoglycerate dehydrogenase-like enzyme